MKKKTIKRKNILSVLAVCIMLMATLLTACCSGQAAATPANEETTKAEVTEEAPAVEQAEEAPTPEPTEESTPEPEPIPEPVVYEGIDMESTLPGIEWIDTFNGIIDEPKWILFNDETNKKVIVENGQELEFYDTDTLAIFIPSGHKCYVDSLTDNNVHFFLKNSVVSKNVKVFYKPTSSLNDGDKVNITQKVEFDDEELELTATLVVKK